MVLGPLGDFGLSAHYSVEVGTEIELGHAPIQCQSMEVPIVQIYPETQIWKMRAATLNHVQVRKQHATIPFFTNNPIINTIIYS